MYGHNVCGCLVAGHWERIYIFIFFYTTYRISYICYLSGETRKVETDCLRCFRNVPLGQSWMKPTKPKSTRRLKRGTPLRSDCATRLCRGCVASTLVCVKVCENRRASRSPCVNARMLISYGPTATRTVSGLQACTRCVEAASTARDGRHAMVGG